MNTEKMREEFEQWYADNFGGLSSVFRNLRVGNEYPQESMVHVNIAWQAWQAARTSGDVEAVFSIEHGPLGSDGLPEHVNFVSLTDADSYHFANGTKLYTAPPAPAAKVLSKPKTLTHKQRTAMIKTYEEMTDGDRLPDGDGYDGEIVTAMYWAAVDAAPQPAEQQPELAKYQPCGCVVCTCDHETQCQGCGAHHCGTHPIGQLYKPAYQQPAPDVGVLVEALEWIAGVDCKPVEGDTDFAVAMVRGIAIGNIRRKAEAALAAYRKGGDA